VKKLSTSFTAKFEVIGLDDISFSTSPCSGG